MATGQQTNGNGSTPHQLSDVETVERFVAATSVLFDRLQMAGLLGESYQGSRNVYTALGWPQALSYRDYLGKYRRQDIAKRIVDLPAEAAWREGFDLDDDDPQRPGSTPFEQAWKALDRRLRIRMWMGRLDKVAGIGQYGVMYMGFANQDPSTPLRRGRPEDFAYVSVFAEDQAAIGRLDENPASPRFSMPLDYSLQTSAGKTNVTRGIGVHWSRTLHCADGASIDDIYGTPRLESVYNLLESLLLVVGGAAEAFWRGARPRYHMNVDPQFDAQLSRQVATQDGTTKSMREYMVDELAKLLHGNQDFIRTSGTSMTQFATAFADPRGSAEVIIDLIAASTGIPKRILLGSERGELASTQDEREWANRVHERQHHHLEPCLVRPFVDRLIEFGYLPEPKGGEYEVTWPEMTEPHAEQRAMLAERITNAEARHAQAKTIGGALVRGNELRHILGFQVDPDLEGESLTPVEPDDDPNGGDRDADGRAPGGRGGAGAPARGDGAPPMDNVSEPYVAVSFADIMRIAASIQDSIMLSETYDRVQAVVSDFYYRTARRLGIEAPDVATVETQRFMRRHGAERVTMIGDETRKSLRAILTEELRKGSTTEEMAARVREHFEQMRRGRSRVIATTETHRAGAFGAVQAMIDADPNGFKTWITQGDADVRDPHMQMHGQTVPVREPFVAPDGSTAMAPGLFDDPALSINCRCWPVPASADVAVAQAPRLHGLADADLRLLSRHVDRVRAGVRRALKAQMDDVLVELGKVAVEEGRRSSAVV